jgi:cytochrome c-type biogenesis protein CcmH
MLAVAASFLILLLPLALPSANADNLDDGVRRIAKQLRCPICESVSVADSPADLSIQMRALIRRRLEAGESDRQILDYFVAAYGDSVLLEPPRRGLGWVVWLVPVAALGAGALLLALVLRVWVRDRDPGMVESLVAAPVHLASFDPPDAIPDAAARVRKELETLREGQLG